MVMIWIPGNSIFIGYTNPKLRLGWPFLFPLKKLLFMGYINPKKWLFVPQLTPLLITFENCLL